MQTGAFLVYCTLKKCWISSSPKLSKELYNRYSCDLDHHVGRVEDGGDGEAPVEAALPAPATLHLQPGQHDPVLVIPGPHLVHYII